MNALLSVSLLIKGGKKECVAAVEYVVINSETKVFFFFFSDICFLFLLKTMFCMLKESFAEHLGYPNGIISG